MSNYTIILSKQKNICENNFYYEIDKSINNSNHDVSKDNKDSYHNFNEFNEDLDDYDFTGIYDADEELGNVDENLENINGNSDIYEEFNYNVDKRFYRKL
jgi:hypothetical protein